MTNAERMRKGFPLKPPVIRMKGGKIFQRGRDDDYLGPVPSGAPQLTRRGYIRALDSRTGVSRGYLSRFAFSMAQYRILTLQSDAMIVRFRVPQDATSAGQVRLTVENSEIEDFPVLGLIVGRDNPSNDIGAGSFNYLYLGGVTPSKGSFTPDAMSLIFPAYLAGPGSTPRVLENSYSEVTGFSRAVESDVVRIPVLLTGANQ
ncbi:hypothetical protein AX16_000671 [Volvariella volvacea WC 439]|nr:hypothetical protein AX16_000671 [Volvariella volvacea WC 439]